MKRGIAAACVIGLLIAGCSSGSEGTQVAPASPASVAPSAAAESSTADGMPAVDAVLDHFITGSLTLTQLQDGSLEEIVAQYEDAQREWAEAGSKLRAGIPGVPASVVDPILEAIDVTVASMTEVADCFRSPTTTECDAESDRAAEDARAMGVEIAALIPYGSRSDDEILAALEGGDAPADAGGTDAGGTDAGGTEPGTVSQSNALEQAASYLEFSAFSRQGLIEQLEFEGYSTADATYAVDAVGADWNEQAALKAQEYLDYSSFSRSGLIEQLEFEGFTTAQATYGVDAVGL